MNILELTDWLDSLIGKTIRGCIVEHAHASLSPTRDGDGDIEVFLTIPSGGTPEQSLIKLIKHDIPLSAIHHFKSLPELTQLMTDDAKFDFRFDDEIG